MVYLKKMEIRGFKSFAQNTEIILNPGINIIVGPNGCGKSNLVDAIRWVLGEANVRQLRGQRNEDVIFNGTDSSRALGLASVELTINNSDAVLPVDYSEVTVARKIYRSGESEFSLNKSRVRMKDIGELFMGTGLGKRGYSIISQGELEAVLNGQPIDRRLILEEASGSIKFRQQRDEIKKRITNTGNDLVRINDILYELKQQQEELSKKAARARQYQELAAHSQQLQKEVMTCEICRLTQEVTNKQFRAAQVRDEYQKLSDVIGTQEEQLKMAEESLEQSRNEVSRDKDRKYELEREIGRLNGEIKISNERIKNNQERIRTAIADAQKYEDMLNSLGNDIAVNQTEYERESARFDLKQKECIQIAEDLEQLNENIQTARTDFEKNKGNLFTVIKEETNLGNAITAGIERLKKGIERKERLGIHIEEISARVKQNRAEAAQLSEEKNILNARIEEMEQVIAERTEKHQKTEQSIKKLNEEYGGLSQEAMKANNGLFSLQDMARNMTGYSPAVKSVIRARDKLQGIVGVMAELIDVPPGLEIAIETAAGKGLENVVIDSFRNAEAVIDYLKRTQAGRVTLLPLDNLRVNSVPDQIMHRVCEQSGILGFASHLVKYEPRYSLAVEYLLGKVVVAEDLQKGLKLFRENSFPLRIVSLEGEIINASGAMTGGSRNSIQKNSVLQRKAEEKKLLRRKEELQQKIESNRQLVGTLNNELAVLKDNLNQEKDRFREYAFKQELVLKQLNDTLQTVTRLNEEREMIINEQNMLHTENQCLNKEVQELKDKLEKLRHINEVSSQRLEEQRETIEKKKRDWEINKERFNSYQEQLEMKRKELEKLQRNINQFEQVKTSYLQSRQEAEILKERLLQQNLEENETVENLTAASNCKQEELNIIDLEINKSQEMGRKQQEAIFRIKKIIIPLQQEWTGLENQQRSLELAIARLETELEAVKSQWLEKFQCPVPAQLKSELTYKELREYKNRIAVLGRDIEDLGIVDIGSLAEYKEICKRVEFMQGQYDDLYEGKKALENLLVETEQLMHKNFSHFLLLASQSFKETFTEIFTGGEASLLMEQTDNWLEAGVEIQVKMPGKRMQSLSLLSGGERALTCIAFIFALLRLKPAPFCLLDEIDAALDETNLDRFTAFIRKMAADIQFIIITHRQATIEAGENIYGVTMPEKGISSILTISLNEAECLAG